MPDILTDIYWVRVRKKAVFSLVKVPLMRKVPVTSGEKGQVHQLPAPNNNPGVIQ